MSETPNPNRPLVLLAEDEPLASMALRAQLEALEFRVLGPARDGNEAVALGACFPIDVGLFDVRMPLRSGIQAALDLFELAPTPVVLLTGVGTADLPDPLPRPPIFEVLSKPIDLKRLGEGLDTALVRFEDWSRNRQLRHASENGDDERELIARAVHSLADPDRPALVATRLLKRARDEGRNISDLAREILNDQPA